METRAKGLLNRNRLLKANRYCIPSSESLENIIGRINSLRFSEDGQNYAENVMEAVLTQHYLCPK